MRLGFIISTLRKPVVTACAAMLVVGGLGLLNSGCEPAGLSDDNIYNGFLAPGEMMRKNIRQPLQLPILNTLSSGFDEPNEEFPNARNIQAADLDVNAQDYVIGRNDLLQLTMTEVQPGIETAKTTRVTESGNITLPLVGSIQAAGLTEDGLTQAIKKKFADLQMIKGAEVSVQVLEARQRTFQIRGAVGQSGQYQIVQADFRMLDALVLARDVTVPDIEYAYVIRPPADRTAASTQPAASQPSAPMVPAAPANNGGNLLEPKPAPAPAPAPTSSPAAALTPSGASTLEDATKAPTTKPAVFVNGDQVAPATGPSAVPDPITALNPPATAPSTGATAANFQFNSPLPEDQSTIIRVPLRQLLNGDLKFNVIIKPQDTIVVPSPQVGEFYLGGHVQRVGVYSLTGRQITLKQAIISGGMLDELGIPSRTEVIRRLGRDREIFVRVDIAKIFGGTQPDIFLKPYDIIQVGTNPFAPFLSAFRNGFRITYGFGFIYDRNYYNQPNTNGA